MPAFFFAMKLSAHFRPVLLALLTASALQAGPVAPRMLLLDGAVVGRDLVVVGERGTVLRSTDEAHTWQEAAVPAAATLTALSFAPGSTQGWAVGHDALILVTHDAGLTWQKQWQGENLTDSFLSVLALDDRHVMAVGAYGLFVATDDGGKTWVRRKVLEEDYHLNRLSQGPSGHLYLAGEHGTLLRSTDLGATWQRIDSPYDGSFYGILPLDAHTLIAHGLRGRIYSSGDDGSSWNLVPIDQRTLIATAVKLPDGAVLFAGQSRAWFIGRDDAKSVSPWPAPFATAVAQLLVLPDGSILALGEAGAVLLPKP